MISKENLLKKVADETILEVLNEGIELKSSWHQNHGKSISAFANKEAQEIGYLIIGVSDNGKLIGYDLEWA